jgi:pimeloyl-ACP methyl ester carboxylesterase
MTSSVLQQWHDRGERLDVPGTAGTRIWRQGAGEPVVLLHGVPSSAYLYRKVLPELANRGLEGVALDFPGLGFADRPEGFDYSWTGLSGWLEQALIAAGLDMFHLVVHDIGGPVGFDLIRRNPNRIRSLTVLNTITEVSRFRKPMVMRPFTVPVLGRLWVMQMNSPGIYPFFRMQGVDGGPSYEEIRAYGELLVRQDGGRAFRQIMDGFELTPDFENQIVASLGDRAFPAQVIWSRGDTALTLDPYGHAAKRALGLETEIQLVNGKHFLQENSATEISERIALLVSTGTDV